VAGIEGQHDNQAGDIERVSVFVRGDVQGVGFRWWTRARALELDLVGYADNLADGRVEICAQGEARSVAALQELLAEQPSTTGRPGRVESCTSLPRPPRDDLRGFGAR